MQYSLWYWMFRLTEAREQQIDWVPEKKATGKKGGGYLTNIFIKGPFKYLNDRFPYPFIFLNL